MLIKVLFSDVVR